MTAIYDADIAAILQQQEPAIRRAFEKAVRDMRGGVRITRLYEALRAGDVQGAVDAVGIDNAAFNDLRAAVLDTYGKAGLTTINGHQWIYPDGSRAVVRWNMANPRAEEFARQIGTGLITNATDDMQAAVRDIIADGYAFGRKWDDIARDIVGRVGPSGQRSGGIVGLSRQQTQWLINLRAKLDNGDYRGVLDMSLLKDKRLRAMVENAMKDGRALSAAQMARIVQNYERNALLSRGLTIARTETLKAIEEGKYESWKQGLEKTGVPEQFIIREWRHTARAARDRPWHQAFSGAKVRGMQVPFVLPSGAAMLHSHDTSYGAGPREVVNCLCQTKYYIDRKGLRAWSKGFSI